jgi:MoaA/NifB/PqqE/SkfB family radical SAM enzyme
MFCQTDPPLANTCILNEYAIGTPHRRSGEFGSGIWHADRFRRHAAIDHAARVREGFMSAIAASRTSSMLSFLWLEITGKCQLECVHCYAESGPHGTPGTMTVDNWTSVLDQAAELGVPMVQFIGGEPTLHPSFSGLVHRALERGLSVEVFSNLVHVSARLWDVFSLPRVRLATSYYADRADQHEQITGRQGSHTKTMNNIREAVRRSIPLRVGVIELSDEQRAEQARRQLAAIGVTEVATDRLREVGRGIREQHASLYQLCGACARGKVAIGPSGDVWPCVFSRWMPVGNVREVSLAEIVAGPAMSAAVAQLDDYFGPVRETPCVPKMCDTQCGPNCGPACHPSCWPTRTGPCGPRGGCVPHY